MVSVPGFLLRRLYVKGSLKNAAGGFEFEFRNSLGSGYSQKVWPLKLDGEEIPADGATSLSTARRPPSATYPRTKPSP